MEQYGYVRQIIFLFVAVAVVTGAFRGNAQELTRPKAKEILEKSERIQHLGDVILFNEAKEANCLNATGVVRLKVGNAFGMPVNASGQIGPAGRNIINKMAFENDPFKGVDLRIWFKSPPKMILDKITGITGQGDLKTVEYSFHFDWTNVGLNEASLHCFANPQMQGKSKLRLYDDGWRVVTE